MLIKSFISRAFKVKRSVWKCEYSLPLGSADGEEIGRRDKEQVIQEQSTHPVASLPEPTPRPAGGQLNTTFETVFAFWFFSRWALCEAYSLYCRAKVGGTSRMGPPPQPRCRGFDFRCIWKNITVYIKRRLFRYVHMKSPGCYMLAEDNY